MRLALLAAVILSTIPIESTNGKQLVLVTAIWRHGDRTPAGPMPAGDLYPPETWPQGYGELWPNGPDEMYQLGTILHKRYQAFMNKTYVQNEIYVRSTDYNRTLMSASAALAGFYSNAPKTSSLPNWPGNWQPVPVHTVPAKQDYVVKTNVNCKTADKILNDEVYKSEEYTHYVDYYKGLMEYLNTKMKSKMDLATMWKLADHLNIAKNHGMKLPDFVNDTILEMIRNASDISATFMYNNEKIQRLRGAPLLAEIAGRMVLKRASLTDALTDSTQRWIRQLKMYAYSAHDITIMAVLENMGTAGTTLPRLASCLVFELYQVGDKFEVVIEFRNDPNSTKFDPVSVKWCPPGACPLDTFYNRVKDRPPKDWFAECNAGRLHSGQPEIVLLGLCQGLLVFLFILHPSTN